MKRKILLFTIIIAILGLTGCGKKGDNNTIIPNTSLNILSFSSNIFNFHSIPF